LEDDEVERRSRFAEPTAITKLNLQAANIIHLLETDSTNAEAMRRALAGATAPLWIRADRQTRGRGRSGRPWQSDHTGNLYASLLLELSCGPEVAAQLSLVTGVAVIDAIRSLSADNTICELQLKWPNDILIGAAKAGGILIESTRHHGALTSGALTVVIGIGLNLAGSPTEIGRSVTSLNMHKFHTNPELMLNALRHRMDHWLGIWHQGLGFDACREAWTARAMPMGTELTVNAGAGPVFGAFQGIDRDGALLLQTSSGPQRFSFGDVTLGVS
jgi:BirA family transcriptional regulator, biotin operon repressor / biotin---[acetyl-CoA-carboxylase] ligase